MKMQIKYLQPNICVKLNVALTFIYKFLLTTYYLNPIESGRMQPFTICNLLILQCISLSIESGNCNRAFLSLEFAV